LLLLKLLLLPGHLYVFALKFIAFDGITKVSQLDKKCHKRVKVRQR